MTNTQKIQSTFTIETAVQLKALAVPIRLEIIKQLAQPHTVKELATLLDWEATKLYYHVKQLEKNDLIQVVETRVVSGIIEKTYQARAQNYQLSSTLLAESEQADSEIDALLATIFNCTRQEIKQSVQANLLKPQFDPAAENGLLWRSTLHLTQAQFEQFVKQVEVILEEMDNETAVNQDTAVATHPFGITVAFYPIARE